MPSINEPFGSNITTGDAGPAELPPLVLSDISPDTMVVGTGTFPLTVTGSGFARDCVVVFDDAEVPTTFVVADRAPADCPVSATAGVVDVEVHRGEDMSDVLIVRVHRGDARGAREAYSRAQAEEGTPRSKRRRRARSNVMPMSIIKVAAGGLPVTIATAVVSRVRRPPNGFGIAVTQSTTGRGLGVTGFTFRPGRDRADHHR